MWAAPWEEVDNPERLMHDHRKIMVTVLFNGTQEYFPNIPPRNRSMDKDCFPEGIGGGLDNTPYSEGRNPHERKSTLHCDDALMHSTRTLMGQLEQLGFKKMEHPPNCPDLARVYLPSF
jgi:hypothetical protein